MTVAEVDEILRWAKPTRINVLGGEPTEHKNFEQILRRIVPSVSSTNLITNLLFSPSIAQAIDLIPKSKLTILANAGDLDVDDRLITFSRNWNHLCGFERTASLTLDHSRTADYYVKYVDALTSTMQIKTIRLSMMYPGATQDKAPYFINNHALGDFYWTIVERIVSKKIQTGFDCYIYPCIFKDPKKYARYANIFRLCNGAKDFMNNDEVLFCWPCESIRVKWRDYASYDAMNEAINKKYFEFKNRNLPAECRACDHAGKDCFGPCGAFKQ